MHLRFIFSNSMMLAFDEGLRMFPLLMLSSVAAEDTGTDTQTADDNTDHHDGSDGLCTFFKVFAGLFGHSLAFIRTVSVSHGGGIVSKLGHGGEISH